MSTTAIVLIAVGVLILIAVIYFATRGSTEKREAKRHREQELGRAADREHHKADEHRSRARAQHAEEERKAHEHERQARELEDKGGKRAKKRRK